MSDAAALFVLPENGWDMNSLQTMLQNHLGRKELYTSEKAVTHENVLKVLQEVYPYFTQNAADCQYLIKFESGIQPLQRKEPKSYRSDIDFEVIDNVAAEVTAFNLGFKWGFPITLVQRGEKPEGNEEEIKAINLLNESYFAESIDAKSQELGRYAEVTGIGYTVVDINTEYEDGDSLFTVNVLDPRTTFVVRSTRYLDHRVVLAVTFREDRLGNLHFTCFTKERRFEILNGYEFYPGTENKKGSERTIWREEERSGERNPLGMIPIVEWFLSYDRQGCFERQISALNNLNLLLSDLANDVDQNTQAIWHTNDVEFPQEIVTDADGNTTTHTVKPDGGEWLQTFSSQDGKTPFIKPLTLDYDYDGILSNYTMQRTLILQKCNVPQRNDNSGGSTGVAMDSATGWTAADTAANAQQRIMEACKMQEVKLALAAIRKNPNTPVDSPLLNLRAMDVKPFVQRNKNYELSVKTTALATMISSGVYGKHAIDTVNLFVDSNQVWTDSQELIEKHQEKLFGAEEIVEERNIVHQSDDPINQLNNSPFIDGQTEE